MTAQDHWVRQLWHITYIFAVPIVVIVIGGIIWCVIRYRVRPGDDRRAAQFQYHIPIEAAYTIIPLVIVAIVFGFMYNAENHVDAVSQQPGRQDHGRGLPVGLALHVPQRPPASSAPSPTSSTSTPRPTCPVLYMPAGETVQLHLVSIDVVHTFYVPEFLFQRDMIPGINNIVDFNVTKPGIYNGQCNNICGEYHAYMRFLVDVMPPAQYDAWYAKQEPPTPSRPAGVTPSSHDPHPGSPRGTIRTPAAEPVLMEIVPGPRPAGSGQVHHQHRPQADRPQLPGHVVYRVPLRRPAGRRASGPS